MCRQTLHKIDREETGTLENDDVDGLASESTEHLAEFVMELEALGRAADREIAKHAADARRAIAAAVEPLHTIAQ